VLKKSLVVLAHAFVGWALCGLTMGIGLATPSLHTTLIIHAIAAPIIFCLVSSFLFQEIPLYKSHTNSDNLCVICGIA
jgi:hypothetical protein